MTTTSALLARTVAGLEVLHRPGTGPTVLALAGLGSSGWAWEALAETLPDIDLYAVSLRGRGGSHLSTGAPGLAGHAADVAAVAAELDLYDVVVVGHSMGAYLALVVAQAMPERIKHLVLVDGGIRPALPFFMTAGLTRLIFGSQLKKGAGPFADVEAVLKKARIAPMLASRPDLRPLLVRMLEHELGGRPGAYVARTDVDRCVADAADTLHGPAAETALAALTVPAYVLLAENTRKEGQKPFISDKAVAAAVARQPLLQVRRLPGNHVTVVFAPEVAEAVLA
jgi:lipase